MGQASALERGSNLGLERRRNGERIVTHLRKTALTKRIDSPFLRSRSDAPQWGEEGGRWVANCVR
jgi:hypothetical protein